MTETTRPQGRPRKGDEARVSKNLTLTPKVIEFCRTQDGSVSDTVEAAVRALPAFADWQRAK